MSHLRAALYFFCGMLLVGVPMFVFAETIPATSGPESPIQVWAGRSANYTDRASACSSQILGIGSGYSYDYAVTMTGPFDQCFGHTTSTPTPVNMANVNVGWRCPSLASSNILWQRLPRVCSGTVYSCPSGQNWTLSGTSCTRPDCVAPEVRDPATGLCTPPPCPAAGQSGASLGATGTFTGSGAIPSTLCVNGCQYNTGGVGVQVGNEWATGIGRSTGATCSANTGTGLPSGDPQTDPKTKCVESGQSFGTVNGVVVCVPATTVTTKGSGSTTTTNKDPQGNTTGSSTTSTSTSTSTTNISGGGSSKTTITTTTNPDGSTTTTTSTMEGEGVGKGEGEGEDDEDYWGTPPEEGALSEQSIGPSSITPVSMGGSGACPAPIALPHNWGSVSYQPACDMAGMIKPITLAFAWLAAVLIAVGGFKDA